MILSLVTPVTKRRSYWLTETACCVPCWMDEARRSWLLGLVKSISLYIRLKFVAMENGARLPAPGKMLALERWTELSIVHELRGFLGLTNYYSASVQNYAPIGTPLIDMLENLPKRKNWKKIGLTWKASAHEASLKLKRAITDIVPLQLRLG